MRKFLVLSFLSFCAATAANAETTCSLGDNECIRSSIQKSIASTPEIDPYLFASGNAEINQPLIKGNFTLENMSISGVGKAKVDEVKNTVSGKDMTVDAKVSVPQIVAEGKFKSLLKFGEFPFYQNGDFSLTLVDLKANLKLTGKLVDGGKRFEISNIDLAPDVKNMIFKLSGLGSDPNFSKFINQIANDSWRVVYKDLVQDAKPSWLPLAKTFANYLFSSVNLSK